MKTPKFTSSDCEIESDVVTLSAPRGFHFVPTYAHSLIESRQFHRTAAGAVRELLRMARQDETLEPCDGKCGGEPIAKADGK